MMPNWCVIFIQLFIYYELSWTFLIFPSRTVLCREKVAYSEPLTNYMHNFKSIG